MKNQTSVMRLPEKAKEFTVGSKKRQLTTQNLAEALMVVFEDHIGKSRGIGRSQLFKTIFGKRYDDESMADYLRWDFTKKAMHLLRQRSNCFIAGEWKENEREYYYFVLKDEADAEVYVTQLEGCIKRMRSMQRRAKVAVEQEWHKDAWQLPGRKVASVQQIGVAK